MSACRFLLEPLLPPNFAAELPPATGNLFPAPATLPTPLQAILFYLRMAKWPSEKLRVFLHLLLTPRPRDVELCRLPSSLVFLYSVLRPFRLGFKLAGFLLAASLRRGKKSPAGANQTTAGLLR